MVYQIQLNRAGVNGKDIYTGSDRKISIDYRISKSAWLPDSLDPLITLISNRISLITGLSTDTFKGGAEELQVSLHIRFKIKRFFVPLIACE